MHCLDGPFLPRLSSPKSHSDPSSCQNVPTLSTSSCLRGNTMPPCCLVFWTPTLSRLSCCYNALCYQMFFYLLGFWCCITFQFHGALGSLKKTLVPVCIGKAKDSTKSGMRWSKWTLKWTHTHHFSLLHYNLQNLPPPNYIEKIV